ncbi:MAG: hypothetical protein R2731_13775 [Nocardioides sp.]
MSPLGAEPGAIDLAAEPVRVEVDGALVHEGTGADVLGHPAEALALAVNELARRGLAVEAGWTVLTGGMTDAVFAEPGSTVVCRFGTLGDVELSCGSPRRPECRSWRSPSPRVARPSSCAG